MYAERGSAGGVSAPSVPSALTVADVSARNGVSLAVRDDVPQSATLMSGDFLQLGLGSGIQVHGGTLVEEMPFDIQSSIDGGLSCIFFLEGRVQTSIGGRSFDFHAIPGRPIQGATLMNARPETFTRRSAAKQRVTHLVINVSEDWLGQHGLDLGGGSGGTRQLLSENLTDHRWVVPHDLHRLIRQIMVPNDGGGIASSLCRSAGHPDPCRLDFACDDIAAGAQRPCGSPPDRHAWPRQGLHSRAD